MKSLRSKTHQQKLCKFCHRKFSHYRFANHKCIPYQPTGGDVA